MPLSKNSEKVQTPNIMVIFGATGDLTSRKLMPALYNLALDSQLPSNFACVGFARREKTHEIFRQEMKSDVTKFSRNKPIKEDVWNTFEQKLYYHISDFDQDAGYIKLKAFLEELDIKHGTKGNRVFYLSTQPSFFTLIVEKLHKNGLIYSLSDERTSRVIIEKPFGNDLASSIELQKNMTKALAEKQLYRIDHYLGKETVQNLLVFRFANTIFESIWNNRYVDHVQITVSEELGIGTRGRFFEEAGILRDIVQNHMMQILSLVAMEPPISLSADAIRDEKVKVLQAIRPLSMENFDQYVVRGQYQAGNIEGKPVPGYREEQNVSPTSNVETFVALELFIDSWRWVGVPFYLRAGKRMPKRTTEISIVFKEIPAILFQS
ncbi:MAG: glucose-6-phosphate dehydrogenase, partial [Chlamydiota bacterium]